MRDTTSNIIPVIMSGGSGSRLWPLSRATRPKQFIKLVDEKKSLFELTLGRIADIKGIAHLIVVCNEDHRFTVAEQLNDSWGGISHSILLEPSARNTAPAIASAAHFAINSLNINNPLLLILPADHVIKEGDRFLESVQCGVDNLGKENLITFGVKPKFAATGYGYISSVRINNRPIFQVEQFVEKPDKESAARYFESGSYHWNSGIFLFSAYKYLEELEKNKPDIVKYTENAVSRAKIDIDFVRLDSSAYESCESESIDYAVMENSHNVQMVEMNASWSDVGSWSSVWDVSDKDSHGNACVGDVWNVGSQNCYFHAENKLIAAVGVENLIIVETHDGVMVAKKSADQSVKEIVEQLAQAERPEATLHRKVYRPWGNYDSIDSGGRFQVKRITVDPGQILSLQKHFHRAEHWVVVTGTAEVTKGEEVFLLNENESTFIPLGTPHRLKNPGKLPLEIIEVQSGSYLGEDDIERMDDIYGRNL